MKTVFVWFAMAVALSAGTTGAFTVDGKANIFGAGQLISPEPGGIGSFGPGQAPAGFVVPASATAATFESITGWTNCIKAPPVMGPDGGWCVNDPMFAGKDTQINSYGGIAGIVARERQMFLVGLFLGDAPPADPAPDRISYSTPADYSLASYSPLLNQIFFTAMVSREQAQERSKHFSSRQVRGACTSALPTHFTLGTIRPRVWPRVIMETTPER